MCGKHQVKCLESNQRKYFRVLVITFFIGSEPPSIRQPWKINYISSELTTQCCCSCTNLNMAYGCVYVLKHIVAPGVTALLQPQVKTMYIILDICESLNSLVSCELGQDFRSSLEKSHGLISDNLDTTRVKLREWTRLLICWILVNAVILRSEHSAAGGDFWGTSRTWTRQPKSVTGQKRNNYATFFFFSPSLHLLSLPLCCVYSLCIYTQSPSQSTSKTPHNTSALVPRISHVPVSFLDVAI